MVVDTSGRFRIAKILFSAGSVAETVLRAPRKSNAA